MVAMVTISVTAIPAIAPSPIPSDVLGRRVISVWRL